MIFANLLSGLLLLTANEALRRSGAWFSCMIFSVLPVILSLWWISSNDFGLFAWAKLYTIIGSAGWLTMLRFTALIEKPRARSGLIVLFGINILEAVICDLANWRLASLLNGIAGLVLLVPLRRCTVERHQQNGVSNLSVTGLGRNWILAFTAWNLAFLYLNYPIVCGHHVVVLGAMLITGLLCPENWLQARINLLAIDLMTLATFRAVLIPIIDTTHWYHPASEIYLGIGSLVLSLSCFSRIAVPRRLNRWRRAVGS